MLDSARCLESRDTYRRMIDFCAERGITILLWHFTDDQGCSLRFDSMPEIASPNAYSKEEMRSLVEYAGERGVTLAPELETLGHSRYITGCSRYKHLLESDLDFTAICPVARETRQIMSKLLAEVAGIFTSPWIHVGMDEVNFGGHRLTRKALETKSSKEILLDYVHFIHGEVVSLGKRMMMWGDRRTVEQGIAPSIPTDVIIANWQYSAQVSQEQIRYFLNLGLDVMLCPALITYDQQFLPGTQLAFANIGAMADNLHLSGEGKVLGVVTTVWTGTRYFHDAQWLGLGIACELMKLGSQASFPAAVRKTIQSFYGCETIDGSLMRALLEVLDLAPLREEFLSVLRLKAFHGLNAEQCRARAVRWAAIGDALDAAAHTIRKNRRPFDTFRFAVELMRYLYVRAGSLLSASPGEDPASPADIAALGRMLYLRMLKIWDAERFEDDPRKGNPVFAFDRAENLLLMFRESLDRFGALMKKMPELSSAYSGGIDE
ncbi:MAG TPA: family 20 glycosylhydrolase [Chthoniobacteraceae bacterium]|nr:family 20 glycosylhydrolase [Chthoniobacteraceae bacterium]